MQTVPSGGQIRNLCKWCHLVAKIRSNEVLNFSLYWICMLCSWRDNSSYKLNSLGPLCLWQCFETSNTSCKLSKIEEVRIECASFYDTDKNNCFVIFLCRQWFCWHRSTSVMSLSVSMILLLYRVMEGFYSRNRPRNLHIIAFVHLPVSQYIALCKDSSRSWLVGYGNAATLKQVAF